MPLVVFEEMKEYVGFTSCDADNLRALGFFIEPLIAPTVDRFYDTILRHPGARAVFTNAEQVSRLRFSLVHWIETLFGGTYDEAYVRARSAIGRVHVRVGLPQHYMFTAMEVIWQDLRDGFRKLPIPDLDERLNSLHKLITIETGIMLQSYKEHYSERVREIEREFMQDQLSHAEHLAQVGQLAASLAHEIKNPLAGISGAIQVIRDNMPLDDGRRPILAEVLRQIARLDGTVKDLLVYARPRPPRFAACNLDRLLRRVLTMMREEPELRQVQFEETGLDSPTAIQADESQIEQVMINLMQNAVQASHDRGSVRVGLVSEIDYVMILVEDRGEGMNDETVRRAFEPFFTLKSKGTGLGLPICKRIIDAHDGSISISSVVGRGTVVTVRLPRKAKSPNQG
ncbi:MAG: protoglobin domain-containing protein [Phycisphaerae bacterium]